MINYLILILVILALVFLVNLMNSNRKQKDWIKKETESLKEMQQKEA